MMNIKFAFHMFCTTAIIVQISALKRFYTKNNPVEEEKINTNLDNVKKEVIFEETKRNKYLDNGLCTNNFFINALTALNECIGENETVKRHSLNENEYKNYINSNLAMKLVNETCDLLKKRYYATEPKSKEILSKEVCDSLSTEVLEEMEGKCYDIMEDCSNKFIIQIMHSSNKFEIVHGNLLNPDSRNIIIYCPITEGDI
ncbi:uncharacterized protein LOC126899196 [Daktulosphaira vitifoliae]|uniref:uncharacterized protein LOC126899196 n=1 Tax=Daktulosphaira vitifoliae TaxID=58002 RepID=UPI0021AA351D|nr:uncharacterized protein LOC126899196 [Daktulosphaira vitifoliae]